MNCRNCAGPCCLKGSNHEGDCEGYTPMSHYDKIRSMSVEEMAGCLAPCACPPIRFNKNTGDIVCPVNKEPCKSDCRQCWLDWLRQEATE